MNIDEHEIENIKINKIEDFSTDGFFCREIVITTKNNTTQRIKLFSGKREALALSGDI